VIFETFDEEIVAVSLDTGNYYSLSKTGSTICMDIAERFSSEEIVDRCSIRTMVRNRWPNSPPAFPRHGA